jgi:hypothetical protein
LVIIVQVSAAVLATVCVVFNARWVYPHTISPVTRLEALYADYTEEEPKETNKERNVEQQWRSLFHTPENNLEEY